MSAPTVAYLPGSDRVIVRDDSGRLRTEMVLTRDEAQALAEALSGAVDDAERAPVVGE